MKAKVNSKELIFQLLLHLTVFLFYSFDKNNPRFDNQHLFYFLNYALAAFIINYLALPVFYKNKNYFQFIGIAVISIVSVVFVEELVLEQIFFPLKKGQTVRFFFALLDALPVITILCGFKFAWDALTKQKEVDQLKATVKESELQFLKSQINPHFLFNNLNNLYSYALEDSKKTPEIILELSGILRYMLYDCKEKYVPLNKEIEQLENFINLNELQIEERGNVTFQSKVLKKDAVIAPLILIVFIENAFKHSLNSQSSGIEISVTLNLSQNGYLNFECSNSYSPSTNSDHLSKGIGLENVLKRLELIYPNAHQLSINDKSNIYHVHLEIDLNKSDLS